jgi:hypothetical protein
MNGSFDHGMYMVMLVKLLHLLHSQRCLVGHASVGLHITDISHVNVVVATLIEMLMQ